MRVSIWTILKVSPFPRETNIDEGIAVEFNLKIEHVLVEGNFKDSMIMKETAVLVKNMYQSNVFDG